MKEGVKSTRAQLQLQVSSDKPQFCPASGEGSKTGALIPHRCQVLPGAGVCGRHFPLLTRASQGTRMPWLTSPSGASPAWNVLCPLRPTFMFMVGCCLLFWRKHQSGCRASEACSMQATPLG